MPDLSQWIASRKQLIIDRDAIREYAFSVLVPAVEAWLGQSPRSSSDPISGQAIYRLDYSAPHREASSARQLVSLSLQSFNGFKFEFHSPDDDLTLRISGVATFTAIRMSTGATDPLQVLFVRQVQPNVTDSIYLQQVLDQLEARLITPINRGVRVG